MTQAPRPPRAYLLLPFSTRSLRIRYRHIFERKSSSKDVHLWPMWTGKPAGSSIESKTQAAMLLLSESLRKEWLVGG